MAKLTGKRFRMVARITTEFDRLGGQPSVRYLWAMRSDGAVLRRHTETSYTILERQSAPRSIPEALDVLRRLAAANGHTIVKES